MPSEIAAITLGVDVANGALVSTEIALVVVVVLPAVSVSITDKDSSPSPIAAIAAVVNT